MLDFLGDVYLDKPYDIRIQLNDFIFNLEFPLSTHGQPAEGKVNLGVDQSFILETFGKLPVAVNLANNHIFDYGEMAFLKTLEYLDNNGIGYFGIETDSDYYSHPYIYASEFGTIANLAYVCTSTHPVQGKSHKVSVINEQKIIDDVKLAKSTGHFVVVHLHWGDEEIKYPKVEDIALAKAIIEAGADIIIGHHAHIIQSMIEYQGKKIYFGLGNFLFPDLDVPAYFDGNEFTGRYEKKQREHNKRSVIITLSQNGAVSHRFTRFDGSSVASVKGKLSSKLLTSEQYQKNWDSYIRKAKIRRFLAAPKLPSIEQLKRFF